LDKVFENSFTSLAIDWELFYSLDDLNYEQARGIEDHIKKMKSKKYILNLKKYPEISEKLKMQYT
jgi:putative endonuclease